MLFVWVNFLGFHKFEQSEDMYGVDLVSDQITQIGICEKPIWVNRLKLGRFHQERNRPVVFSVDSVH